MMELERDVTHVRYGSPLMVKHSDVFAVITYAE